MAKVKFKIRDLLNLVQPIQRLSSQPLPASTAFQVFRFIQVLNTELTTVDQSRMVLFKHYGKLSEDGSRYNVDEANTPAFNEEYESLLNTSVELETPELGGNDFGSAQISPMDIMLLEKVLTK
jgi:hypothetical protein